MHQENQDSGDDSQQEEDEEEDAHPSKRDRVVLDSDEAGLASSMHSIWPTPGATSQYHQENGREHGDATGQGELEGDMDHEMPDDRDTGKDDNQIGFQDNGICFQNFC